MKHIRATWDELPVSVRTDLERYLGSPVVSAVNQDGGFSPGLAARVGCADGRRAFVKAVGAGINPDTPRLFRAERDVAAALPASVPAAPLRHFYDDGDWVALVFDEIDGAVPEEPWRVSQLERVLAALGVLAETTTPCPVADLPLTPDVLAHDMAAYARLADDPPADLDPWERRNLDRLVAAAGTARGALAGNTLVHMDIRSDNLLITGTGDVVFVDWAWAGMGPAWLDTLILLINAAVDGLDPQEWAERSPLLAIADPGGATAVLAGLSGMWAESARKPPPPGLPTVRDFQRRYHQATLAWLRQRTGWS